MNREQLVKRWLMSQKRQESFKGWDFSSIYDNFWQEDLEWSYQEIVKKYLTKEMKLLDMVFNAHESFDLMEVRRVLKPKGVFVTQQVGDLNGINLASRLIPKYEKNDFNLHLSSIVKN